MRYRSPFQTNSDGFQTTSANILPMVLKMVCMVGCVAIIGALQPIDVQAFQTDAQKELHAKQVLIRGLTHMRTGFPDKAAILYAEGLKVSPDNSTLLSSMADAQFAMGELSLASFYLDKALVVLPNDIYLNQQALFFSMEAGNAVEAVRYSNKLVSLSPNDLTAHLSNMALLQRLDQHKLAATSAEKGIAAFPNNEDMLRAALPIFVDAGQLNLAKTVASSIARLTKDPEDMLSLAKVLTQQGELGAARALLRSILALDSDMGDARATLNALTDKDSLQVPAVASGKGETNKALNPSASSDPAQTSPLPTDPSNERSRAEQLFNEGKFEEVLSWARLQIDEDPRQLDLWVIAMRSLIELNQIKDALELADDGGLLFPGYAPLLFQHARALKLADRPADALELATKALSNAPPDSALHSQIQAFLHSL